MLPFVSAALIAALQSTAVAVGDFEVSPSSFRIRSEGAALFEFPGAPIRESVRNTPVGDVWKLLNVEGSPSAMEFTTATSGFLARFGSGMSLTVRGLPPPFITWADGSVGEGVPSQPSRWALLSWPTPQPPLLIVFRNRPASLIAVPTPDGFELQAEPGFQGWLEFKAPLGGERVTTRRAADLGALLQKIQPVLGWMVNPSPRLREFTACQDDRGGMVATWKFDRAGAEIPPGAQRAVSAKLAELATKTTNIAGRMVSDEAKIAVRLPMRRLLPGIPVLASASATRPPEIGEWNDYAATVNAAFAMLAGNVSTAYIRRLERHANDSNALSTADANVQSAQHLLRCALGEESPHLSALEARLDPRTWTMTDSDETSTALLAVAFAIDEHPGVRAWGAMINAVLRLSRGRTPLSDVRAAIYGGPYPSPLGPTASPVRVLTPSAGTVAVDGRDLIIQGGASAAGECEFRLYSEESLRIAGKSGLSAARIERAGNTHVLRLTAAQDGVWRVRVTRPAGSPPLPAPGPSLGYSASPR
jgi:hypothetical protein